MAQRYLAQINLGLENLLKDEIKALGGKKIEIIEGGVEFDATRKILYQVLLWSRLSSRIYWRIDDFIVPNKSALFDKIMHLPWLSFLSLEARLNIHTQWDGSTQIVGGEGELENVVKSAILKYFQKKDCLCPWFETSIEKKMILQVRLYQGKAYLSLDMSGELMHKRNYRTEDWLAPIRPNLAAALLQAIDLSACTNQTLLLDPMCGSGTILLEAFLQRYGLKPRIWSHYAVMDCVGFDLTLWQSIQEETALQTNQPYLMLADQAEQAVHIAEQNFCEIQKCLSAQNVQITRHPQMITSSIEQLPNDSRFLSLIQTANIKEIYLICNPPYGIRIEEDNALKALLQSCQKIETMGLNLKLAFIYPSQIPLEDSKDLRRYKIKLHKTLKFKHGGLNVNLWQNL